MNMTVHPSSGQEEPRVARERADGADRTGETGRDDLGGDGIG